MKIIETNTIINSDGKVIFNFPKNTLLDLIPHDLWENIIYYSDYQIFIVGDMNKKYNGYHLVTTEEFTKDFIKLFTKNYRKNNSLIAMENIGENIPLFIDGRHLLLLYREVFLIKKSLNKFVLGRLYSTDKLAILDANIYIKQMSLSLTRYDSGFNLFVSDQINI